MDKLNYNTEAYQSDDSDDDNTDRDKNQKKLYPSILHENSHMQMLDEEREIIDTKAQNEVNNIFSMSLPTYTLYF